MRFLAGGLFVAALLGVASFSDAQPPGGGGKGGFGGKGGGFGAPQPGQIMPAFLQEMLKLNDDQKKQLADLQKDVDAKLDKMLTDDQKKQLKEMRENGPGGFGGGKGGFGGKGGDFGGKGEKQPPV